MKNKWAGYLKDVSDKESREHNGGLDRRKWSEILDGIRSGDVNLETERIRISEANKHIVEKTLEKNHWIKSEEKPL